MSFDALTLAAVRDELEPLLRGSRIQRLVFPDELSLVIECFAPGVGRTCVLCSAHPEQARVQQVAAFPPRGLERDTPFLLVARKHLRTAHIRSLRQPRLERVLELDCEQRDASGQHYRIALIVEAMGRRSNLVLVADDGTILDAARRTPPSRNPRRAVLPHLRYEPPPPQDRLLPEQLSPSSLAESTRGRGTTLATFLGQTVAGLSPQAARELAFRSAGNVEATLAGADWSAVVHALDGLLQERQPTLATRDGQPMTFAPYRLEHLAASGARLQSMPTISAAIDAFYAGERPPTARGDALAGERKALLEALRKQATAVGRRIASLERQLDVGTAQRDPLRLAGELILTYQPATGSTELSTDGQTVALDPTLSASENAQAYFARYRKAREATERVPELLTQARNLAAHLAELHTLVEVATDMNAIRALRREAGVERVSRKQAASKSAPYHRVALSDGWQAFVGASATGNAAVTFDLGAADDLWLHARAVPGAHVILHGGAGEPSQALVERAAQLAAWHSAARSAGAVEVDVTPRRYVKKVPNGPPGLVRYANERTLRVTPRQ
jgi:predicted ribosome quality control (RQC) complex YloA/Tae2 family protein